MRLAKSFSEKQNPVNFIQHWNAWMSMVWNDDRLTTYHVCLYTTLFMFWNQQRFQNPLSLCRKETMKSSKIGSRTTYLKCLHELSKFGYIDYHPSQNPRCGSEVIMHEFCPIDEQSVGRKWPKNDTSTAPLNGQKVGPPINIYKHYKHKQDDQNLNKYDEPL